MSDMPQDYRDRIATVSKEGKRVWIYPKKPKGYYYRARTYLSWVLLLILFGMPFLRVNGRPFVLFNVLERKFILFGVGLWPQDFHLMALLALTFLVFVILFTVIFGRLFCGWICPQTVFLEMVFRKIEYWIDGDANAQRKLDQAHWTWQKIQKRVLKHGVFYALSFLIGNTFLSYIIGTDALYKIISSPPTQHLSGFMAMLIFSFLFYGVFAWFREQACVIVCPYGRLQGVLLDKNSIVVSYDYRRGEPRGVPQHDESQKPKGDCVDCKLCVKVCPTGIDIRNGTQLECVNCTACMDACDSVMAKFKRPAGLVRYDSSSGIESGRGLALTPRIAGYSVILCLLLVLVGYFFWIRQPLETTVLRMPGKTYQILDGGMLQNVYNIHIVNKSFQDRQIRLRLEEVSLGEIQPVTGRYILASADAVTDSVFFIRIPGNKIGTTSLPVVIEIYNENVLMDKITTQFTGPLR